MLQYGLRMNDKNIYTLQFTDDQLLTVQGKEDLEYMIWKIKEEYEKAWLTMNLSKTKYLCIGKQTGT